MRWRNEHTNRATNDSKVIVSKTLWRDVGWSTCVLLLCVALLAQPAAPVEQMFYNARVFTAEPQHSAADAIAIRGDTIVAVGARREAFAAVSAGAEKHDVQGRTLLPGTTRLRRS